MTALRIEFAQPNEPDWHEAGVINPTDPYGSISDNHEGGRDVYFFGVDAIEGTAVIKKSIAGYAVETARTRIIHDLGGVSLVASLLPGEEYEMTVRTDVGSGPLRVKFTHLPNPAS